MKLNGEALRNGRTLGSKVLMSLFLSPRAESLLCLQGSQPSGGHPEPGSRLKRPSAW